MDDISINSENLNLPGEITPDAPIFTIGIISKILNVHQRTLRIYDDAGLLVPSRNEKKRRLYSMNDVEKGKFIQYLTRELGINLAGVKIIINLLEQLNVSQNEYVIHVRDIAIQLGITEEQQLAKKQMLSKRGRKATHV